MSGNLDYRGPQSPLPSPLTVLGADNGTSIHLVAGAPTVQLGDDVALGGSVLTSDRQIASNGFRTIFKSVFSDAVSIGGTQIDIGSILAGMLSLGNSSIVWFDNAGGGNTIEHSFFNTAGDLFELCQLGGANSGFLLNVTRGRICFGNNVIPPTAIIHLLAGVAGVSGAPFKYTAGAAAQAVLENGAKNFNGSNEFITAGGVNYTLAKTLTATAALDFPNTVAQTSSDLTIALTGAALGDIVLLGVPNASVNNDSCYTAFVSAAGVITVRFNNYSAAAIDPASGTFRVAIVKY